MSAAPRDAPTRGFRLRGLELEDLALLAYFALLEPLAERWLADLAGAAAPAGRPWALLTLGAAAAAAVCLATRDASEGAAVGERGWMTPATYARLPLLVVLAFFLDDGFEALGSSLGERLFPLLVVFVVATLMVKPWLPVLAQPVRRLLMLPAIAVGAVRFRTTIEDLFGGSSLEALVRGGAGPEVAAARFGAVIVVVASLLYYVLFVFAPRQVAAGRGLWLDWAVRYLAFLAALLAGLAWGGAPVPGEL